MRVCPSCGEENADKAKFCSECATPLAKGESPRETRKLVTVLFADMSGSTALGERLDPEALRGVIDRYFDAMKGEIERHGGLVEKFIGDAVMAVFGIPQAHEDDAFRAIRAALGIHRVLDELNVELEREHGQAISVRIGINTGEVVTGDSSDRQRLVTGDTVNVAARFEQAAKPGDVLIGRETSRLVRDAVRLEALTPLELKGKSEPIPAFRVLEIIEGADPIARRSDTAFVGRERELGLLADALDRVRGDRSCYLFTMLGIPGVGKSRLVAEVLRREPGVGMLSGRCLPYGDGITFWPVLELVNQAAGISETDEISIVGQKLRAMVAGEDDAAKIEATLATLLGVGTSAHSLEETFWGVRRFLETVAAGAPLVVVLDDLHWAEPTLLDLVEHVLDWTRDAPILLLCVARPELLEARPGWGGGKMNAATILLEPFNERDSSELVELLLRSTELPEALTSRIVRVAEGNPLFVEELLSMLVDDGALVLEDGAWRQLDPDAAITLPTSIQALLAARLDQLQPAELRVVEGGAVVGQVFYRSALAELAPESLAPDVGTYLRNLVRKDVVRPERGGLPGDETYRFRHILIRDAAYRAMSKRTRAELHERFAGWLVGRAKERLPEFEEIVGYHFEQAYRYREELGERGDDVASLAGRAGQHLAAAGRRAVASGDRLAAAGLFQRAAALLPDGEELLTLLLEVPIVLDQLARFDDAVTFAERAVALAATSGSSGQQAFAELITRWVGLPEPPILVDRSSLLSVLEVLEEEHRTALAAQAWSFLGWLEWLGWRAEAALDAWRRAIAAAEVDPLQRVLAIELRHAHGLALLFGPTPLTDGIEAIETVLLPGCDGSPVTSAGLKTLVAEMRLVQGDDADVEGAVAAWRETLEMYGLHGDALNYCPQVLAEYHSLFGRFDDARRVLTDAQEESLERFGSRNEYLDMILAGVEYQRGDFDEAERVARVVQAADMTFNIGVEHGWRLVLAKIAARDGDDARAMRLLREADELIDPTDSVYQKGDHQLSAAEIMTLLGRRDEGRERLHDAMRLYREKHAWAKERLASSLADQLGLSV